MKQQNSRGRGRAGKVTRPMEKYHSQMKVFVEDVALWRLLAAERSMPYGWIEEVAAAAGVSASSVTMAIGGQTWADMTDPPPVSANERWAPRERKQSRPLCPTCARRRYEQRSCRDRFHAIDHRTTRQQKAGRKSSRAS
jgi:hypothetical protein